VLKTPKLYFLWHRAFCATCLKRSPNEKCFFTNPIKGALFEIWWWLNSQADAIISKIQIKVQWFGRNNHGNEVDLSRSRDYAWIFLNQSKCKCMTRKLQGNGKIPSPFLFYDSYCLKRISEYREIWTKKESYGKVISWKDFPDFVDFHSYRI